MIEKLKQNSNFKIQNSSGTDIFTVDEATGNITGGNLVNSVNGRTGAVTVNEAEVIDITNGLTEAIKNKVTANPSIILFYSPSEDEEDNYGYYFVPQYHGGGATRPSYYNCFEGDESTFRWLEIDWDELTFNPQEMTYATMNYVSNNYLGIAAKAADADKLDGNDSTYYLNYNNLNNKPTIPTVNNGTLTIQKNGTTVNTFTANSSSNVTANITVPTTLDDISDGSTRKLADYLPRSGGTGNPLTAPVYINHADLSFISTAGGFGFRAAAMAGQSVPHLGQFNLSKNFGGDGNQYGLQMSAVDITNNRFNSWRVDQNGVNYNIYNMTTSATITPFTVDTAGKITSQGSFELFSNGSSWNEGIRIHPSSNNWSGIVLCEASNSGGSGTSANTWSIHNHEGAFGFYKNGSSSGASSQYLCNENGTWTLKGSSKNGTIAVTSDIPTVNNGTLTIQKNGSNVATFTANQSGNTTANISVPTPLTTTAKSSTTRWPGMDNSSNVSNFVTPNDIYFWNGAVTGTTSYLAYCNQGAFGNIVTHAASEFQTAVAMVDLRA